MSIAARCALLLLLAGPSFAQTPAVKKVTPFSYAAIEHTGPYTEIPAVLAAYRDAAKAAGIKSTSPVMTLYINSPLYFAQAALVWEIGQQLGPKDPTVLKLPLVAKRFAFTKIAAIKHVGPYTTTYKSINALYDWIAAQGLKTAGGPCVELYLDLDKPAVTADQVATEIWIPVK